MKPVTTTSSRNLKRAVTLGASALLLTLASWGVLERAQSQAAPSEVSADPAEEQAPDVDAKDVQITFAVTAGGVATVTWGKQRLGKIEPGKPLVVTRPRDSGPLDVVVRAPGFLPVHTRAHTFASHRMLVKLTKPDQTTTLLGYRIPLDAGTNLDATDGGVPPELLP